MHVVRPALADARGFTLVELLVVILIVGILAMIALPTFTAQRLKGQDAEAQQMIRIVATALAAYQTDEDTYDATRAELVEIEPTVTEATAALAIAGSVDGFEVSETSKSGTTFTMIRETDGTVTRTCSIPNRGLCRNDTSW